MNAATPAKPKSWDRFNLPIAGLNSLLEILTRGYQNGLNNLTTPMGHGASNNGMFGGFAPTP